MVLPYPWIYTVDFWNNFINNSQTSQPHLQKIINLLFHNPFYNLHLAIYMDKILSKIIL